MGLGADFNFAQPFWLWALVVPILLWFQPAVRLRGDRRYKRYADRELLPHLLLKQEQVTARWRRMFVIWTLVWTLGCVAMAGPRWDYTEVELFQPGADVVILLDLSRSMDVPDLKPSRLQRALQEIDDLLNQEPEVRIGLIGFASVAHVIVPITDDFDTLRHLLPSISTELIDLSGSRLSTALDRAKRLLSGQYPGSKHSLLLISDGDFAEYGLDVEVGKLKAQGISVDVLGVGTSEGGPVPDQDSLDGGWMTDQDGKRVLSRLNQSMLEDIAKWGGGIYVRADFRDYDTRALIKAFGGHRVQAEKAQSTGKMRVWKERFYWLVGAMLLLVLPWFRRKGRVALLGG